MTTTAKNKNPTNAMKKIYQITGSKALAFNPKPENNTQIVSTDPQAATALASRNPLAFAPKRFCSEHLRHLPKSTIPGAMGTTYSLQCRASSIRYNTYRFIACQFSVLRATTSPTRVTPAHGRIHAGPRNAHYQSIDFHR
uniref:Uncharacterized protein n=1 Tax=Romanomermis culicivorax TaxID=13658 RepID=A0A915JKK2_ROMCU